MSFTVQSIADEVRIRFPDLTNANFLIYLNSVRSELASLLQIGKTSSTITTLSAGTKEYALTATIMAVDQVVYNETADDDDAVVLEPTTETELFEDDPYFEYQDNSTPQYYYLKSTTTGPVIGLHPTPDTTSSGGYPRLTIREGVTATLLISDTIYDDFPTMDVYADGVRYKYAHDRYPEDEARYFAAYELGKRRARRHLQTKNRRTATQMTPAFMSRRRRSI